MKKQNAVLIPLLIAQITAASLPVSAAEKQPVTLQADNIKYNDKEQKAQAEGNITMENGEYFLKGQKLVADFGKQEAIITKQVFVKHGKDYLNGEAITYNYGQQSGVVEQAKGTIEGFFVGGKEISYSSEYSVLTDGTVTKCDAKVPDYHLSADRVEIYPGDKIVAYGVGFWVKDKLLFTRSKYVKSLQPGNQESQGFPKVGFHSKVGAFIKANFEFVLDEGQQWVSKKNKKTGINYNDDFSAFVNPGYYTKEGLVFNYGLVKYLKSGEVRLAWEKTPNDDGDWVFSKHALSYNSKYFPVSATKWNYRINASTAKVSEENTPTSTTRHMANVRFERQPWVVGNTTIKTTAEMESRWYGTGDYLRYALSDTLFTTQLTPKLKLEEELKLYALEGKTPFRYDEVDLTKEFSFGFTYQLDKLWAVGAKATLDLNSGGLYDMDYTVTRNLHCFESSVTYRAKREEIKFSMKVLNW